MNAEDSHRRRPLGVVGGEGRGPLKPDSQHVGLVGDTSGGWENSICLVLSKNREN